MNDFQKNGVYQLINGICLENIDCITGYSFDNNSQSCIKTVSDEEAINLLTASLFLKKFLSFS